MNLKPNILIVSVFQKSQTLEENTNSHKYVMQVLKANGIPCLTLHGKYDGSEELSILFDGFEYRDIVEKIAKTHKQECYLESHNDRATFLVYPDGTTKSIGTLVPVSKEEAEVAGSYSYNPRVDQHFITR